MWPSLIPRPKKRREKDLGMRLGCYQGDYSVDTRGLPVSLSALVCLSTWCPTISGGEGETNTESLGVTQCNMV